MLKAVSEKITLKFKQQAGTSRGVLKTKNSWIISVWNDENPGVQGIGEASIIEGLSPDWDEQYEERLQRYCSQIHENILTELQNEPSIHFAFESALLDLKNGGTQCYFDTDFFRGKSPIRINGLIWMGDKNDMLEQIKAKIDLGFSCIKLKIGAIRFEDELDLLKFVRNQFSSSTLELRVDANGAFEYQNAMKKLEQLSRYELHSIEQPIRKGQWEQMHDLCMKTPLPIALDEELIGITSPEQKDMLIEAILPQYIILKPSLTGGFKSSDDWISAAEKKGVKWWITSALESNIGLNAIAQYTASKNNPMPQGLGTGSLFENNTSSQLNLTGEWLHHH